MCESVFVCVCVRARACIVCIVCIVCVCVCETGFVLLILEAVFKWLRVCSCVSFCVFECIYEIIAVLTRSTFSIIKITK